MNTPKKTSYISATVFNDSIMSEWEKEYEIPENMPDISRLIRMDSSPFVYDCDMKGSVVNIEGKNNFHILYKSSDDDKIIPIDFSDDFNITTDSKTNSPSLIPYASVFCNYVSCKVLSPRKIYIKSKNKTSVDVKDAISFETPDTSSGNDILFYNTNLFPIQEFQKPIRQTFDLEETFTIDGTYPSVENVIFSTVRLIPLDLIKNIGSVTLNASALFKVFYESGGNYVMFSRSVPVSLTVSDEDIDENTLIYYALFLPEQKVEVETDNYGEERVLRFSYSPELILFKIKESEIELPTDVISQSDILECEFKNISYDELCKITSKTITVEKIFELPDADLTEIYDTSAVMDVESLTKTDTSVKLDGICSISVLGKTSSGIDSANFTVNFTEELPELADVHRCECSLIPLQVTAMVTGRDIITVKVTANANIRQYNLREQKVLSDFSRKLSRIERDKNCLTLYYPNKKESLWNIAKEYGIDPENIAKENKGSFSSDGVVLDNIRTLIIP